MSLRGEISEASAALSASSGHPHVVATCQWSWVNHSIWSILVAPARLSPSHEVGHLCRDTLVEPTVTAEWAISEAICMISNTYTANQTTEAAPMPLAPAEANCILFAIDDFVALPANAHAVNPSPTIETHNARVWSDGVARWLVLFPA